MVRTLLPAGAGEPHLADAGSAGLLNVKQVVEHLGVSAATVYALCDRNELAHIRVANAIRVSPTDLAAFLTASTAAPSKRRRRVASSISEPIASTTAAPHPAEDPAFKESASAATPPGEEVGR